MRAGDYWSTLISTASKLQAPRQFFSRGELSSLPQPRFSTLILRSAFRPRMISNLRRIHITNRSRNTQDCRSNELWRVFSHRPARMRCIRPLSNLFFQTEIKSASGRPSSVRRRPRSAGELGAWRCFTLWLFRGGEPEELPMKRTGCGHRPGDIHRQSTSVTEPARLRQ